MQLVDITELTAALLTISAVTKVLVDMVKLKSLAVQQNADWKYLLSAIIPVAIALITDISIFETENLWLSLLGSVGAGLIAGLGSNFIHELMRVLQTVKDLKK